MKWTFFEATKTNKDRSRILFLHDLVITNCFVFQSIYAYEKTHSHVKNYRKLLKLNLNSLFSQYETPNLVSQNLIFQFSMGKQISERCGLIDLYCLASLLLVSVETWSRRKTLSNKIFENSLVSTSVIY